MRAAPARRRGRCAKVAKKPAEDLRAGCPEPGGSGFDVPTALSVLAGGGALGVPAALSALGGEGGLGMRGHSGPDAACHARGGGEGQAALTALLFSMLDTAKRAWA